MSRLALSFLACLATAVAASGADSAATVRVMSFNIRYDTAKDGDNAWDKRKAFLAETIAAFNPDLLGTQETLADQRDFLAGKLTGYAVFAAGRDDGKDAGEMAAVFYRKDRFEKLDSGHFWFSETPDRPGSKGWDSLLPRVATWVKLRDRTAPDGKPVLFLNAHLDHRGVKARLESARLIRTKVSELARLTGLHGKFGKAIDHDGGGYGQAVLSRFPLDAGTVHPLPGMPKRETRIAFEVRLTIDGRDRSESACPLAHGSGRSFWQCNAVPRVSGAVAVRHSRTAGGGCQNLLPDPGPNLCPGICLYPLHGIMLRVSAAGAWHAGGRLATHWAPGAVADGVATRCNTLARGIRTIGRVRGVCSCPTGTGPPGEPAGT